MAHNSHLTEYKMQVNQDQVLPNDAAIISSSVDTGAEIKSILQQVGGGILNAGILIELFMKLSDIITTIVGISNRVTAQTAANASIVTTIVGATDTSFLVDYNALITATGSESFTIRCDFTDENNTARTLTMSRFNLSGVVGTTLAGINTYLGIPTRIRCKAGTSITIYSTGTFTGCTYNVEASIRQLN
jgi:hypothetical protein